MNEVAWFFLMKSQKKFKMCIFGLGQVILSFVLLNSDEMKIITEDCLKKYFILS